MVKPLYGLTDIGRRFYMKEKEILEAERYKMMIGDSSVFFKRVDGVLHGIIMIHVDDFCIGGSLGWPKKHHFANIHSARPVSGYIYWDELLRKILGHFDQDLTQRRPFQLGTEAKIIKILKTAKTTLKWPRIKKFCLKDTPKYGDFRGCLLNKKFWLEVFKCPKTPI